MVTVSALTKLAEVKLPAHWDLTKVNLSKRFGLVIPDERADRILSILGGGDLDDTLGVHLRKVYGSRQAVVNLVLDGVLNPELALDATKLAASSQVAGRWSRPAGSAERPSRTLSPAARRLRRVQRRKSRMSSTRTLCAHRLKKSASSL